MSEKFSKELNKFFGKIGLDKELQKRLYNTVELSDVADIANELGFTVSAADIIKAQAGRIQESPKDQLDILAAGKKPHTVAQWGRGGKGFLEAAGYWFVELLRFSNESFCENEQLIFFIKRLKSDQLLQKKIKRLKTFNELYNFIKECDCSVTLYDLINYQARVIESLDENEANRVASGSKGISN